MNRVVSFLEEYKNLCSKYQLFINACGCCGSPWINKITEADDDETVDGIIRHLIKELPKVLKYEYEKGD